MGYNNSNYYCISLLDLNMTKINLAITGFKGRMGQQLIKSLKMNKNFKLVALTESKVIKKKISNIKPALNDLHAFKKTKIIIDFCT